MPTNGRCTGTRALAEVGHDIVADMRPGSQYLLGAEGRTELPFTEQVSQLTGGSRPRRRSARFPGHASSPLSLDFPLLSGRSLQHDAEFREELDHGSGSADGSGGALAGVPWPVWVAGAVVALAVPSVPHFVRLIWGSRLGKIRVLSCGSLVSVKVGQDDREHGHRCDLRYVGPSARLVDVDVALDAIRAKR